MRRTIRDLIRATSGTLLSGFPQTSYDRVSIDSRSVKPGDLFVALRGPHFNGHDFLLTAANAGASAVLVSDSNLPEFHPDYIPAVVQVADTLAALQALAKANRLASDAEVIGLTGSNGKTTTKEMIACILREVAPTLATRGNLNNQIGLPLTLTELGSEHRFAVIEMGTSKKGDMELLVDLTQPRVGIITNVGKDHLEFLDSPEGVLAVNRGLYDALGATGTAVINLDDPLLAPLAQSLPCKIVTYGAGPNATVRASSRRPWPLPSRFTLHFGPKTFEAELSAPGAIQVENAVAAAAVAWSLGIPAETIVSGLKRFTPASMRMQVIERSDGTILLNDAYNANPSSVRASVSSFCGTFPDRKHWLVLGDMRELGALSASEHEQLGQWLATQSLDRIFLYGRDTRFALKGLLSAGAQNKVERFKKKRRLLEVLKAELKREQPAILFKASRSLKLEHLISALTDAGAPVPTH